MLRARNLWLGGLLVVALAAAPARAADLDKYLPEDTETIVTLNVRQLVDSKVVKKIGLDQFKEALKGIDEVSDALKDLGFDPFKDLDSICIAGPGGNDQDKGLVIVHGKFDVEKFKAKANDAAKNNADVLKKIHKSGTHEIYEVHIPGDQDVTLFVTIADKGTILAAPGKDYVVDALKRVEAKKNPGLKNKQIQTMIEKMDTTQTLSLGMVGDALAKAEVPDEKIKAALSKIETVSGGISVTDELKLEFKIGTKTPADAKEINKTINDGLNQGIGLLALLNEPKLAPVVDFLKTVKASAKDKDITIKGKIDAEAIEKALDKKDF